MVVVAAVVDVDDAAPLIMSVIHLGDLVLDLLLDDDIEWSRSIVTSVFVLRSLDCAVFVLGRCNWASENQLHERGTLLNVKSLLKFGCMDMTTLLIHISTFRHYCYTSLCDCKRTEQTRML